MKRRPPHLRKASGAKRCHNCKSMNRVTGICARYQYPVTRGQVCDTWRAR